MSWSERKETRMGLLLLSEGVRLKGGLVLPPPLFPSFLAQPQHNGNETTTGTMMYD